jgi:hypothetical protein
VTLPSAEVLHTMQLRAIEDVESQLRGDALRISMADGSTISREAAWAATQSIRSCWRRGLPYDGQERMPDGQWWALAADGDEIEAECIGAFPEELQRG